ncbi:MAG TPA: NADH:ubiquinone reductase (Na(+)-transporting) subunit A [Thermoanaerobaculia bacterium]|nr:NADH:ubiquinone reductase (Na(+)-transporting) subunit A [Thermoanaerobaculia bacterium]
MGLHKVKRGLDLPIVGVPDRQVDDAPSPGSVALVAADYPGMKPQMSVAEGDPVRLGQLLFEDKKQPGVRFTSPGTGTVTAINRGAKRALQSVVVRLDGSDDAGGRGCVSFSSFSGGHPGSLSREDVSALLVESGLWTALRGRPFGRVAAPGTAPHAIFVTAMDSQPLAPDVERFVEGRGSDFERGMAALARLTDGLVYLCRRPGTRIEAPPGERFRVEEFAGPHPAGTPGLHIHTVAPVGRERYAWYLGLQDVLAIGRLFETGALDLTRIVALGGPSVTRPRHLRTRAGASLDALTEGELTAAPPPAPDPAALHSGPVAEQSPHRVISGSVLSGRRAMGPVHGYLGRYHQQISAVPEDRKRELLGWMAPGADRFSVANLFLSKLIPGRRFAFGTSTYGSPRAIVPIGLYEKVVPLDLQPTFLLKSLVMQDIERAEELGCLELEEDDLALCTFVDPGKIEYGPYLRQVLMLIEKEG